MGPVSIGTGRRGPAGWVARAGGLALDLLLPPLCPGCATPVQHEGGFCAGCFAALRFITEPCCDCCGRPLASAAQGGVRGAMRAAPLSADAPPAPVIPAGEVPLCVGCVQSPPPWQRARAALRYDRVSGRLVLGLKNGDRTELAAVLAAPMAHAGASLLAQAGLLVPVPLHRGRLLWRRYNQAALLAWRLGRLSGLPVLPDALVRLRRTSSMRGKDAAARAEAAAGAFAVRAARRGRLAGRRVLLVDDVLTTGATVGACAQALLAAGASGVDVLAAARAGTDDLPDRPGRDEPGDGLDDD